MARILGVGAFAEVNAAAESFEYEGLQFRVLSVDGLIASKRAAGREKDRAGLIELQALKEARDLFARVDCIGKLTVADKGCHEGSAR